jgi:hypothetical protein
MFVTTNHGTSLSMDCKYEPSFTSRWDGTQTRLRKESMFVTRGPSKLAKQPNNRKTVAHNLNFKGNHTIRPCHWLSMTCYLPPSLLVSSVWQSMFFIFPQFTNDSPSLFYCGWLILADSWLFTVFYSVLQCRKQRCAFFSFPCFFCRCYKSGGTTTTIPVCIHVLHMQPSSRKFWLMALSVTL